MRMREITTSALRRKYSETVLTSRIRYVHEQTLIHVNEKAAMNILSCLCSHLLNCMEQNFYENLTFVSW